VVGDADLDDRQHVETESTIGNTGFRLGATRRTLQTDSSVSRLSKLSLFRRHLLVLSRLSSARLACAGAGAGAGADAPGGGGGGGAAAPSRGGEFAGTGAAPAHQGHGIGDSGAALAETSAEKSEVGQADAAAQASRDDGNSMCYLEAKRLDSTYVAAREVLMTAFKTLGGWLENDEALHQFRSTSTSANRVRE
jgi:hypothetical protein